MEYYTKKQGKYPEKENRNTNDDYYGNGWSVKRDGNNYVLSYVSGALQGEYKSISINREDFEAAKAGQIDLDQLCRKYKVS